MGNAGGKAVNSGVDYQSRVAAWCIFAMWQEIDLSAYFGCDGNARVSSIGFETSDPIDDLRLVVPDHGIWYLQVKRSPQLSAASNSEFAKAIMQFVVQFAETPDSNDRYFLVVSSSASVRIKDTLRLLLTSIRKGDMTSTLTTLNKIQRTTLDGFLDLFQTLFANKVKRPPTSDETERFLRATHVACFDIEEGLGLEQATLLMISMKSKVPATLLWKHLITEALQNAKNRNALSKLSIDGSLRQYEKAPKGASHLSETSLPSGFRWPSGREVFLLKDFPDKQHIAAVELYRFNDDNTVRNPIANGCIEFGGQHYPILLRAASRKSLERLMERNPKLLEGQNLVAIGANYTDETSPDESPFAKMQEHLCIQKLLPAIESSRCLHCGRYVWANEAQLIELNEPDAPHAAGIIHNDCHRPTDRVVGYREMPNVVVAQHLETFDARTWCQLCAHGQLGIGSTSRDASVRGQVLGMIVNPGNDFPSEGPACIQIECSGGTSQIMNVRGRVHRLSFNEADKRVRYMLECFASAKERGDPFCLTTVQGLFARYSAVLRFKHYDEDCDECDNVRAINYSTVLERFDEPGGWYTPIAFLADRDNEKTQTLGDIVPLLSNPGRLGYLLENWDRAGFSVQPFHVNILSTDLEFGVFLDRNQTDFAAVVVDPIFDGQRSLVSGVQFKVQELRIPEFVPGTMSS